MSNDEDNEPATPMFELTQEAKAACDRYLELWRKIKKSRLAFLETEIKPKLVERGLSEEEAVLAISAASAAVASVLKVVSMLPPETREEKEELFIESAFDMVTHLHGEKYISPVDRDETNELARRIAGDEVMQNYIRHQLAK